MQDPVPPGGNVLKREWLRHFATEPERFDRLVCSWDTASTLNKTSSYSVGMLWGNVGPDYCLLELVRGRWEVPELRRLIIDCQCAWRPDVMLVEGTELGRSLRQDIFATRQIRLELRRPRHDKEARLLAQSARLEGDRIHIAEGAGWTAAYVSGLLAFPYGRSDDQVDATSQALDYLTASAARSASLVRRNLARREVERRSVEDRGRAPSHDDGTAEVGRPARRFTGSGSIR